MTKPKVKISNKCQMTNEKNSCPSANSSAAYNSEDAQWEKDKQRIVLENILTLGFWI
jgi:hypothetical protein